MDFMNEASHYLPPEVVQNIEHYLSGYRFSQDQIFYQMKQENNEVQFEVSLLINNNRIVDLVFGVNQVVKIVIRLDGCMAVKTHESADVFGLEIQYSSKALVYYNAKTPKKIEELRNFSRKVEDLYLELA